MDNRRNKRFAIQLRVKLNSGPLTTWGILCDVSENGLFVKSNRGFIMDTAISIEIFMPDNTNSIVKGIVKRKIEMSESYRKHGLGIELIEKDAPYQQYVKFQSEKIKAPVNTSELRI